MEDKKTEKKPQQKTSPLFWLGALMIIFLTLNGLFLFLLRNEAKTVGLLKVEHQNLMRDEQLIKSSQTVLSSYKDEIAAISDVFPNEETLPDFIVTFEEILRRDSDEYSMKFTSSAPVKQQDAMFLPIRLTLKTNLNRLQSIFDEMENLFYMTHIDQITAKTPEGFKGAGEYVVNLKLYVQNPFNVK